MKYAIINSICILIIILLVSLIIAISVPLPGMHLIIINDYDEINQNVENECIIAKINMNLNDEKNRLIGFSSYISTLIKDLMANEKDNVRREEDLSREFYTNADTQNDILNAQWHIRRSISLASYYNLKHCRDDFTKEINSHSSLFYTTRRDYIKIFNSSNDAVIHYESYLEGDMYPSDPTDDSKLISDVNGLCNIVISIDRTLSECKSALLNIKYDYSYQDPFVYLKIISFIAAIFIGYIIAKKNKLLRWIDKINDHIKDLGNKLTISAEKMELKTYWTIIILSNIPHAIDIINISPIPNISFYLSIAAIIFALFISFLNPKLKIYPILIIAVAWSIYLLNWLNSIR